LGLGDYNMFNSMEWLITRVGLNMSLDLVALFILCCSNK
jgi:hypothetical protein